MDTPSISIEEIIATVAKKHKVLLNENDPILVTTTLNQLVVKELLESTNTSMENLKVSLEEMYFRQSEENKENARRIMNLTLNSAREIIIESAEKVSSELTEKIKLQQELFIARCNETSEEQRKAKITTILFSCVAIAAAAISATVFLVG